MGGLRKQTFISHSSGGYKSKVKVLVDAVHGESLLPGVQAAALLVCSEERERDRARANNSSAPTCFFFFFFFKYLFIIYLAVPGSLVATCGIFWLPKWLSGKESAYNAGDVSSIPGSGRFPRGRTQQPTPVVLPEEIHGQKNLVSYIYFMVSQRVGHDLVIRQQQQ